MYLSNKVKGWPNGHRAVLWAGVIVATGLVVPYLACLTAYGLASLGVAGIETTYRLRGLVFPALSQWPHLLDQMLIQLPPFLAQAAVSARILGKMPVGPSAQRFEYRIGGCLAGLTAAALASFLAMALTQGGWVRPGLDVPVLLILSYYGGGLVLGLIGGLYGRRIGRRRIKSGHRARNPVLRGL